MTKEKRRKRSPSRRPAPARRARPGRTEDFITDSIEAVPAGAVSRAAPEGRRSLGARIREAREMHELTLEDLSSRTGIPVDRLDDLEADRMAPPLGQLVRLGKALDMKMGYFLSTGADRPMCVVRADSGPKVARRGKKASEQSCYVYESLAAEKANRTMEPFLVSMVPTEFRDLSTHDGQEFLFVLEGEVRAQVGNEVEVLRPGDSVYYDSASPHLITCHGKKPARILAVLHAADK